MANTTSAIKNTRKTERRTEHNRAIKSRVRTLGRNLQRLDAKGASAEEKKTAAIKYVSALDKAAKTGVIHTNMADRRKAACAKFLFGKDANQTKTGGSERSESAEEPTENEER